MVVLDALWPAPKGLTDWGRQARAGMMAAMFRRRAPQPRGTPVYEALGPAGVTSLPVRVEPHSCYLVAAGLLRGRAPAMRLSARLGAQALILRLGDGSVLSEDLEQRHKLRSRPSLVRSGTQSGTEHKNHHPPVTLVQHPCSP